MKLSVTATVISLMASFSIVLAVRVGYDTVYDNPNTSLSTVACSDGSNGMLTKGYTTFGSLPSFPNIGSAQAVAGWNSPSCGSCWQISYGGKLIYFTAIDHADNGFVTSSKAMNTLTKQQAQNLGVIDANATQVSGSSCGL
ncbi:Cerato-platanin [Lactarius tabidus]